ncbi:MAG: YdcF family protein [Synechococcales cyanobacterium RM1_1_8]|nr:YdcF family protein [Synechococcales cyanobacterium RM1_1_8]
MLQPPNCPLNPALDRWTDFTWHIIEALSRPGIALGSLVLVGLGLLLGAARWPRAGRWGLRLGLGWLGVMVLLPLLGGWFLPALTPEDRGSQADAIVVLGRGQLLIGDRAAAAAQLFQAQRAPMIFATGETDAPLVVADLVRQGIDPGRLDGEACSQTTLENAQFTAQLLEPKGIRRIILVTDPPHLLRSGLTFRRAGFEVQYHAVPFPRSFGRYRTQIYRAREVISFMIYGLLGHYF